MKGFRPVFWLDYVNTSERGFASTYKHYIGYSMLENSASDTAEKIISWSNKAWKDIGKENIKVIPRVFLIWSHDQRDDDYWPSDIGQPSFESRWATEQLKNRLVSFIYKMAEAWDNDPRVAAVELGLWGYYGEQHIYPIFLPNSGYIIPIDFQNALGEAAAAAFKNKKVMVRNPDTFINFNFGFYWDSFALPDDNQSGEGIIDRDNWKDQMISGEVAYDWGVIDQSFLGTSPDETLKDDKKTNNLIKWIKDTHASSLGWIADYSKDDNSLSKNAARVQKILGYRYVINSATYNRRVNTGEELSLELQISNVGSAPFYYKWPVQLMLLNLKKQVVWKETANIDIRQWLPGETKTISIKTNLSTSLSAGNYILAISILDPSGNLPSLRFANTNYYNGGITPLGIIGIGQEPVYYSIKPFDALNTDNSLYYVK